MMALRREVKMRGSCAALALVLVGAPPCSSDGDSSGGGFVGASSAHDGPEACRTQCAILEELSRARSAPDATAIIQRILDDTARAGGGAVKLPAGIFIIREPLIVGSNVHFSGSGMGATILRRKPGVGKVIDGAGVYASIATVGANDVSISDLTVDHATFAVLDNGVSLLPAGEDYTGQVSTNCVVQRVEVLGSGDFHQYMIWNLRGQHVKILDNYVDGGVASYAPTSVEEGIETFGGTDVLISGNTVKNVGNICANVCTDGRFDTGVTDVIVTSNYLQHCKIGAFANPSPALGGQHNKGVQIRGNVIQDTWMAGVYLSLPAGGVVQEMMLADNTIEHVGTDATSGEGIWLEGDALSSSLPDDVAAITISRNHISGVVGTFGYGVAIVDYPKVQITGNVLTDIGHSAIYVAASDDADISLNRIESPRRLGILVSDSDRAIIRENTIFGWDTVGSGTFAIYDELSVGGYIANNAVRSLGQRPEGSAIFVAPSSSEVRVGRNVLLYAPINLHPIVNLGSDPSFGTFVASSATTTISNALVTAGSRISLTQRAGAPVAFVVTPADGHFDVVLPLSPATPATFYYDIQ